MENVWDTGKNLEMWRECGIWKRVQEMVEMWKVCGIWQRVQEMVEMWKVCGIWRRIQEKILRCGKSVEFGKGYRNNF